MSLETLKKNARILFRKMQKEDEIDLDICNDYIGEIEDLKEDLEEVGCGWIEKFEDLDEVEDSMWGDASEEEITQEFENAEKQLDRILMKLGIDSEDSGATQNTSGINIHLNNSSYQSQSQSQHQSQNLSIRELEEQLEEELTKERPSESKARSIIGNIIEVTKNTASEIISRVIIGILK